MFDDLETLVRVVRTFFSEQEWSSLLGYALGVILGIRVTWPIVRRVCWGFTGLFHGISEKFFPPVGPVCSTVLDMLQDPDCLWNDKTQEFMGDGILVVLENIRGGKRIKSILTGKDYTWNAMRPLSDREKKIVLYAVLQAADRVNKRDGKALEKETVNKLNDSRTCVVLELDQSFKK